MAATRHLDSSSRRKPQVSFHRFIFAIAFLFRFLIFGTALAIVHDTLSITTPLESLLLTLALGHIAGTLSAFSPLRAFVGPLLILFLFSGANFTYTVSQDFFPDTAIGVLGPYSLLLDVNLLLFVLFFGYLTTWAYWRVRFYATLELLSALFLLLTFFAPHRDFQLALAPRIVHALAWDLNTSPYALIIILGGVVTLSASAYLALTSHAGLPGKSKDEFQDILISGGNRPVLGTIILGLLVLLVSLISREIYAHYESVQESVGANGVGFKEDKQALGKSPLGFHSALGSNNQPAAVVRLGGDYQENPTSPMLYLREAALSEFNGKELVNAGKAFDDDIPGTAPTSVFQAEERLEYIERVPVVQSIYLLTDHDVVFSVDYPLSIQPLENPAPQRFQAAYKAYSVAPSYSLSSLADATPGNPDWSKEVWDHYLVQHKDKRYEEEANDIVGEETNPAIEASMLVQYLNNNAIYTLTPNHEVDKDEDPVAPFLFGDMRGYCVHFAHATVYMLRALGIPARIATGYLTDLSQARDGHILLRMSDRHAWAEAYFEGYGWVPFDTQPKQVESHADTEVDAKLLEELMGLIGPEKTLIPEEAFKDEPGLQERPSFHLPSTVLLLRLLALILAFAIAWKLLLWYGYLLPTTPEKAAFRAYRAIAIRLSDLGYTRKFAETFNEYLHRIGQEEQIQPKQSWQQFRLLKYGNIPPSRESVRESYSQDLAELSQKSLLQRFVSFFNPLTLFQNT